MKSPFTLGALRPAQLLVLALAPLALLLWLGWHYSTPTEVNPEDVTARPALWKATKGDASLWLFGTIHVVPKNAPWLSPAVAKAVDDSDQLYLEVTGLDAERKSRAVFEKLGRGTTQPPITARLGEANIEHYRQLQQHHGKLLKELDAYDSWAAALLINAAAASEMALSSTAAGEAVFAQKFTAAKKPIRGLETIEEQLGIFDGLSEGDQRQLLSQSIAEADSAPKVYTALHSAWAQGDTDRLEREFNAAVLQNPGLRGALVDGRNTRWALHLDQALGDHAGTTLAAVGIGHLIGDRSVQVQLQALGWQITRVQ